jgi:hypothetical protein
MMGIPSPYDFAACPAAQFLEVLMGVLQPKSIAPAVPMHERLDLGAAQSAALGMRTPEIAPGAPVEVLHCHPQLATWAFSLPREVPRMALQIPDQSPCELEPKIRTVLLEPELNRICITWVGEHQVPTPIGPGKQAHIRHGVRWSG